MENVYPLNPKQLGTYQKRPQPANHFTQSAGKDLITPQTWRKTGKREKCGLKPSILMPERSRGFENPLPRTEVRGWHRRG